MSGFVYFVEEVRPSIDLERVRELNLGHAFEGSIECSEGLSSGPCELGRGLFFSASKRLGKHRTGFFPDVQTWRRLPEIEGEPQTALGFWTDDPPTPETLARSRQLRGLLVTLNKGAKWQIPSVRALDPSSQLWSCELPRHFDFDATGKLTPGRPQDDYAYLWDLTAPLALALFETEETTDEATDAMVANVAVELLKANYLVDVPELVQVEAFLDDEGYSFGLILAAACMKDRLMDWVDTVKKNGRDRSTSTISNITAGKVGSVPDTGRAGAI